MSRSFINTLAATCALVFGLACAGAALAHPPRGLVVDPAGRVWFSDLRTVWKIDAQGRLTTARAGADHHTHELGIDAAGNVYGEDSHYDPATGTYRAAVWRLTPDGRFAYVQPPTSSPPIGLSVWRDAAGRTWLADHLGQGASETLLFRRHGDGSVARLLGTAATAARYRPVMSQNIGGAAIGPDGSFYFRHGPVLRRARPDGRVRVLSTALPRENFGIAAGDAGEVFVADFGRRRVLKIAPGAAPKAVVTAEAPWAPTGVFARGRDLYVLEGAQNRRGVTERLRVRRISPGERPIVLATVPVR